MVNDSWTPIYSGKTNKLIAGVVNNDVYIFMDFGLQNKRWTNVGRFEDGKVFSCDSQLIGEIKYEAGDYCCIIDIGESIGISKDFCEQGLAEWKQKGLSTDYYEKKLEKLNQMMKMPRFRVAYTYRPKDKDYSGIFLFEAAEKYVGDSDLRRLVLYSQANAPDQNTSPLSLAAAFLVIQHHVTFDDCDRPLKCLWDF